MKRIDLSCLFSLILGRIVIDAVSPEIGFSCGSEINQVVVVYMTEASGTSYLHWPASMFAPFRRFIPPFMRSWHASTLRPPLTSAETGFQ